MRQITLDPEVLEKGIDDAGLPTPDTPAAVVREAPEELASRYGLRLQETHDDLGEMVFAVVQGHEGPTFALERHRDEPGEGTTISLFMGDVIARRLDDVLRELRLSREELLWEIPEDGIQELEQISGVWSARRRQRPSLLTALVALVSALVAVVRRDRGPVTRQ
jgi:hypothetical protein